ncbi:variable surface lipoprotein [Mycoplasmopsis agalactiae]|uniref:variable surface lipoprotein n=1 Tax=Mycoplasmopsis agalactiae TaxID=2110 RepID=UPI00030E95CC|nr:variable surface lipoprotein [Mycoplasmopsis agalactiae]
MKKVKKIMLLFGSAVALSSLSVVAAKCEDANDDAKADNKNAKTELPKNDMSEKMDNHQERERKVETNMESDKNNEHINRGGRK